MRRLLLCSAAAVAICAAAPAFAADLGRMPARAPVMAAPAFFSWNGFYIGGHAGYGFNDVDVFTNGQAPINQANVDGGARPEFVNLRPDGFTGGLQLGYNFQVGSGWVFGFETDISYTDFRDEVTVITSSLAGVPGLQNTFRQELEFLGTVRGRIGYAFDRTLFYVTGGLAYGGVNNSVDMTGLPPGLPLQFSGSERDIRVGYAVGGGIEHAFTPNWSVKLEYLYYDLGDEDAVAVNNVSGNPALGPGYNSFFDNSGHIVRAGINYRFGGGPVMASY